MTFDATGDIDAYVQCLSLIGLCRRSEGRYADALEQFRTVLALIDDDASGMTPTIAVLSRRDAHVGIAQRAMSERAKATVIETRGSHAVFVSRSAVVAAVISQAAQGLNDQP